MWLATIVMANTAGTFIDRGTFIGTPVKCWLSQILQKKLLFVYQILELKTTCVGLLAVSMGQKFRSSLAEWFWLKVSHEAESRCLLGLKDDL